MMSMGTSSQLPAYLAGATNAELATLMQQARDPSIRTAVDAEVKRRRSQPGNSEAPSQAMLQPQTAMPEAPMPGSPNGLHQAAINQAGGPSLSADAPNSGMHQAAIQQGSTPSFGGETPNSGIHQAAISQGSQGAPESIRPSAGASWTPPWDRTPDVASQAISTGTAAANEATGTGLPPDLAAQAEAFADADDPTIQRQVMERLLGSDSDKSTDIAMSLARAGFTMAASSSPHGLTALGEGANAGLDYYDKARQREAENAGKAADIEGNIIQQQERTRAAKTGEGLTGQQIEIARRNAIVSQRGFELEQRKYDEGKSDEHALKQAQIKSYQADIAYKAALAQQSGQQFFNANDGTLYRIQGGQAAPVLGQDGQPIQGATKLGSGATGTAQMRNIQDMMTNLGVDYATAYGLLRQGASMPPDRRRAEALRIAQQAAASNVNLYTATPEQIQQFINDTASALEGMMTSGFEQAPQPGPAPGIGATPAPIGGAAPTGGQQQQVPVPPALKGRRLQYNPGLQQYRDPSTGEVFDANGNLVQ